MTQLWVRYRQTYHNIRSEPTERATRPPLLKVIVIAVVVRESGVFPDIASILHYIDTGINKHIQTQADKQTYNWTARHVGPGFSNPAEREIERCLHLFHRLPPHSC